MKRIVLVSIAIVFAAVLTGCQSGKNSTSTDDAQSAPIVSGSTTPVNAPPVPPVPSRPSQ